MSDFTALQTELMATVTDFRQHGEHKTAEATGRIDELEALLKRAHAGGPRAADRGDGEPLERFEGFQIFRKHHSLVDALTKGEERNLVDKVSLGRLIKGAVTGNWKGADIELELSQKSQSINSLAGGGFLVPELVANQIVDAARPLAVTQRLGAGTIPIVGFTKLPTLNEDVTPSWKLENQPFAGSTMQFGAQSMNPRTVGFFVTCSRELLEDSGPELEGFIRRTFAAAYASELDRVTLNGSGTNSEPIGLLNHPGVNATGSISAMNYDHLIDGAKVLFDENFSGEYKDIGVVMNPRTAASLAKIAGTSNDHYITPPTIVQDMRRLQTTHIPIESSNTQVLLGDFRQVAVALRTGLSIEVSSQAAEACQKHQIVLKATARLDIVPFRPKWFHRLHGVTN